MTAAASSGGPPRLGEVVAWRLDRTRYAPIWDSGEGAFREGGRWNSPGTRVVYCSLDAATAVLEVAVHKGFRRLDEDPHTLTSIHLANPDRIRFVFPADIPEPHWLEPGEPDARQRSFGDALLAESHFVAIPSVVSRNSWNLLVAVPAARGEYTVRSQEPFVLDPRLHRK